MIDRIILDMTGAEFKKLIEEKSLDGKLNTIPEILELLQNVPEGMTLAEYIRQQGGGTPAHDSVDSDSIKDHSIKEEDLEESLAAMLVKDGFAEEDDVNEIFG